MAVRCALHVTIGLVQSMGCCVIYGDTYSFMCTVPMWTGRDSEDPLLIGKYFREVERDIPGYNRMQCLDYLCGSSEYCIVDDCQLFSSLRGCVPKIISHIMSFTCLVNLKIEAQ